MQSIQQNPCRPGNESVGEEFREQEYTKTVPTDLARMCVAAGSEKMKAHVECLADFNSIMRSRHNEQRWHILVGTTHEQAGNIKLKQDKSMPDAKTWRR